MFFLLNGLIILFLFFYFAPWLFFSATTTARVVTPFEANTIHIAYTIKGKTYFDSHMRNGVGFPERAISVRYLRFHPSTSRINSFMGMVAEPLAWWGVFLMASAMLLLTDNSVFSKGTIFQLQKRFPWISMEEYFLLDDGAYFNGQQSDTARRKQKRPPPDRYLQAESDK